MPERLLTASQYFGLSRLCDDGLAGDNAATDSIPCTVVLCNPHALEHLPLGTHPIVCCTNLVMRAPPRLMHLYLSPLFLRRMGSWPAVNCVFRDTLDRPAILIRPDGRVSIQGSLFFNNTFVSRNRSSSNQLSVGNAISASNNSSGDSSNDSDLFWGAGSAIYVMARGVIEAIEASAFVRNGNGCVGGFGVGFGEG